MRNAGDGTPGGSTGRRQRVPASAGTARPAGNGGASLFTPAYRVRHAAAPSTPEPDGYSPSWSESSQSSPSYRQSDSYRQTSYPAGTTPAWADDLPGGGYSWMTDEQAPGSGWPGFAGEGIGGAGRPSNAIRGFPPVPDEPLPIYPPGPFAAWNRDARGSSSASADLLEPPSQGRPMTAQASTRMLASATITPDEFDTNHSMPAIKDPVIVQSRAATGRGPVTGSRMAARASAAQQSSAAPAPNRTQAGRGTRGTSRSGRPSSASRSGRGSKRQPVRLAIGVATVIIVAVAAILVVSSLIKPSPNSSANNKPNPGKASASPTSTAPAGKWQFIGTRQTDPIPLSLHELYPGAFVTNGVYFHTAITSEGHGCRAALIGAAIQTAVKKADCSQVLRASYVARADKAMATIGVFNLATSTAASAAALHAGRAEFVGTLAAKNGVTSKLGQGSGLEEAVVKGHYLVLVWAEYVDLSAPKTASQRLALTNFMNTLVQATVNTSLSYRMIEGKPTPPPTPGA